MLSITPMISVMRSDDRAISSMMRTAPETTSPPRAAVARASVASCVACSAASAVCFTLDASWVKAAEVSCKLLAEASVRCDRSRLPASISPVAEVMPCTLARTSINTAPIFSTKALNDADICATSSLPTTSSRRVKSPPPVPMVSIASRTLESLRKAFAVKKVAMPSAARVSRTKAMPMALTTPRRPTVASALSSAITRYQSVPATAWAFSSFGRPWISTSSGALARTSFSSIAGVSAAVTSLTGLSI